MILSVLVDRLRAAVPQSQLSSTELVNSHYDFVWRLLRRMGLVESDADDATQQVFMVTLFPEPKPIRAGSERSFLYGVALNVLREFRRKQSERSRHSESALETQVGDESPFRTVAARQAWARLQEGLGQMPDDIRSAFVLFELEGLTMAEIAEVFQVPPGTVASRLRRARELFQAYVQSIELSQSLPSLTEGTS